jgi:hypothetical protein
VLSPKNKSSMKNSSIEVSSMDTACNPKTVPQRTCVQLKYHRSAPLTDLRQPPSAHRTYGTSHCDSGSSRFTLLQMQSRNPSMLEMLTAAVWRLNRSFSTSATTLSLPFLASPRSRCKAINLRFGGFLCSFDDHLRVRCR